MKKILIAIIFILLIFGGVLLVKTLNQSASNSDNNVLGVKTEVFSLEVVTTDNSISTYQVPFTPGSNLSSVLSQLSKDSDDFSLVSDTSDMGEFVQTINGVTANIANEFWSLQVNGKGSQVGISDYKPQPNDQIQFILTKF